MASNLSGHDEEDGSAYERLVDMLVSLELEPGSVISEATLAGRIGGSRTVLREAVAQLAETGLVSVLPRTGVAIAPVRLLDVQNVYEARAALEVPLVRLATERASQPELDQLREIGASLGPDAGPADFIAFDRRVHSAIATLARNSFLSDAIARVMLANARLWALFFRLNGSGGDFYFSHDDIIATVCSRDVGAAQQAVLRHLEASRSLLRSVFWPE